MNSKRPTKEKLIAAGWKKATAEQVEVVREKLPHEQWDAALSGGWCYSAPCESGGLTCYLDENGRCTDCYRDPLCG